MVSKIQISKQISKQICKQGFPNFRLVNQNSEQNRGRVFPRFDKS